MEQSLLKTKYDLKELEMNSLLEITQAINNNLPEESLYKIYNFTLRANLNIKKLALYVLDERWNCKVNFGSSADFYLMPLEDRFLKCNKIMTINKEDKISPFSEFDKLVPVSHKDKLLAFVFVGGYEHKNELVEPEVNTTLIQALSNIIIVAIENKKLARRQLRQEALRKELEIAKNVQQLLFPKDLPYNDQLQLKATYIPHHAIGGDYYDYLQLSDDDFLICIADVSGKGVPAAILMSNFQASLHTLIRKTQDLREIIPELNFQILKNANGENFITFFIAFYNKKKRRLYYVNSGHNPPLLIHKRGLNLLNIGTTILGSFKSLPFLEVGEIKDLGSFFFFAYTDGLTELFNEKDEEYGSDRLELFIRENYNSDLTEIHNQLIRELNRFKGAKKYHDDITFMSCRYQEKGEKRLNGDG
jgi:phosphoserine phosphatase RsbU/P